MFPYYSINTSIMIVECLSISFRFLFVFFLSVTIADTVRVVMGGGSGSDQRGAKKTLCMVAAVCGEYVHGSLVSGGNRCGGRDGRGHGYSRVHGSGNANIL